MYTDKICDGFQGMIDVRGLTISDISVKYAESKQLLFAVKEISLSFDTSEREPLHIASAPLVGRFDRLIALRDLNSLLTAISKALNVKNVVFHGDNELAKLSNLQRGGSGPASLPAREGKGGKRKGDRFFWMLRLVILRLDRVRLELEGEDFALGVKGSGICLSFLASQQQPSQRTEIIGLKNTQRRRSFYWKRTPHKKVVLPRISVTHFEVSFLAKETRVSYPVVTLTELCLSLSGSFVSRRTVIPPPRLCGCQLEQQNPEQEGGVLAKTKQPKDRALAKLEEVELRIERCGLFIPAILVKLLAELRSLEDDGHSLQEEDDKSSVASSISSSIMSQLTFLGNPSKLARLTQATVDDKRSTRSDSTDSTSWECVNCSFYNSELDNSCLVCGYNGDGEKTGDETGEDGEATRADNRFSLENKLASRFFDLPVQCAAVVPVVVVTLEGEEAISPLNPYSSPGSLVLHMGLETSMSSSIEQAPSQQGQLSQKVHVEYEFKELVLSAQDVLSEQLLSNHKTLLRMSRRSYRFPRNNFTSLGSLCFQLDILNAVNDDNPAPTSLHDAQIETAKKRHMLWPTKRSSPQQEGKEGEDDVDTSESSKRPQGEWECSSCSFVNTPTELECGFCGEAYLMDREASSFRMTTSAVPGHDRPLAMPLKHSHLLTLQVSVTVERPLVVINPSLVDHAVALISLLAPFSPRPSPTDAAPKPQTRQLWLKRAGDVSFLRKASVACKIEDAAIKLQSRKRERIHRLGGLECCEIEANLSKVKMDLDGTHFIPSTDVKSSKGSTEVQQHVFIGGAVDIGKISVKERLISPKRKSLKAELPANAVTLFSTPSSTKGQFQLGTEQSTKLFDLVAAKVEVPEFHSGFSFADAFYLRSVLLDTKDMPRMVASQCIGLFKKARKHAKQKPKKRRQGGKALLECKEVLLSLTVAGMKCCCHVNDTHQPLVEAGKATFNLSVRPNTIKTTNRIEHIRLKLKSHELLLLEPIQITSKSSSIDLNIPKLSFTLPANVDLGEVVQNLLLQRKALRTACARFDAASFTLDNGNISPSEESPRATQRTGLRMLLKREHAAAKASSMSSKSRRRLHLRLSVGVAEVRLMQTPGICDQKFSREINAAAFPQTHARATEMVSTLCRIEAKDFEVDVNYSWKEHRRSELVKRLWAYDDCRNVQQAVRAHEHGFSFVTGMEISALSAEFVRMQLRNHGSPLVFAKNVVLQAPSVVILAALKSTECCTRWQTVVLGKHGSNQKDKGKGREGSDHALEVERCQRSSVPIKLYYNISINASALDVNHGECLADAIRALDEAMGRLLPKSSDKTSPSLGWWDKLRYLLHGVVRFDVKLFLLRLLTRSPWHGQTGLQFQLAEMVCFNSREASGAALPAEMGPSNLHWSEILSADPTSGNNSQLNGEEAERSREGQDKKEGDGEGEEYGSWTVQCQSFVGSLVENCSDDAISQYDLLHVPLVLCTISLHWVPLELQGEQSSENLLDHYVQLHHPFAHPGDADLDMYKYFRAHGLELGIRMDLGCALKDDSSVVSGPESSRRRRVSITQSEQAMEATKLFKDGVITEEEYELLLQADKSYKKETTEHVNPDTVDPAKEFKSPSLTICWPAYDLLSDMIRVIAPPGPGKLNRKKPAFGRLLKELKIGILADNPRILWWETAESDQAVLAHAKSLVTKLELERPASEGWSPPYGSPPGWMQRALLVQCLAVNGHFVRRVGNREITAKLIDASGVNWDPWSAFPFPYASAADFMNSQDHFLHCKAFMLTRGRWRSLVASTLPTEDSHRQAEGAAYAGAAGVPETKEAEGFRIRGDECRLIYTLNVRDALFHCVARVVRDINEQARVNRYLASKSITGTSPSVVPLLKSRSSRASTSMMHLLPQPSWRGGPRGLDDVEENTWTVEHDGVLVDLKATPYKPVREPSEGMKALLQLSTSRMGRTASASSSSFMELMEEKEDEDPSRRPRRESFQSYASSVKEEDVDEGFEDLPKIDEDIEPDLLVELRWPQVNLVSGKDSALLGGDHGMIRLFKTLLDCDVEGLSLLKRELAVAVHGAKIYVAPNEAAVKNHGRWVKLRPDGEALCVQDKLSDYGFRFEIIEGMPLAPPDPDPKQGQAACQEVLKDLTFTVDDTAYTAVAANNARSDVLDPRRLNQVDFPANVIAVHVPSFGVQLNSFEFFTVLGIIRNLLLVPPSHNLTETHAKKLIRGAGSTTSVVSPEDNNVQLRARSASSDDLLQGNENLESYDKRIRASTYDCELSLSKEATVDEKLNLALAPTAQSETFIDEKMVRESDVKFREAGQDLKYLANLVKGLYGKHREALNRRERHILYNIDQGTISLSAEVASSDPSKKASEVERVKVFFTELKGIHKFDMVDCTKVHVSLQTLELIDCRPSGVSNTGILVGTLKHSTSSSRQAPFLRVEAYTAPPLYIGDYKVNLYRRLQVHLFPGAEYTLRLMLNKSLAYFLSEYFVDEDEDDEEDEEVVIKNVDTEDDKRKPRKSKQKRKKKGAAGSGAVGDGERKVKEKVYFHYVRTSRLNILVYLDHVPLVPNSGINLVANGNYNLMVSGIVIHSQLMSWTKLYKHIRNQAIKGVVKSLIIPVKRRPDDPHAIRHMSEKAHADKQGEKKADTDDLKDLKTEKLLFGRKRE